MEDILSGGKPGGFFNTIAQKIGRVLGTHPFSTGTPFNDLDPESQSAIREILGDDYPDYKNLTIFVER